MQTRREFLQSLGASAGLMAIGPAASATEVPKVDLDSLVGPTGVDWGKVRASFLLPPGLVYMNNGSLGPNPAPVLRAMWEAWEQLQTDPVGQGYGALLEKAEAVRAKAAAFLGCHTDELAITQNTTEGMNAIAQGMDLKAGDRVLTTDHEHAGGLVGWQYHAERRGVVLDTISLPLSPKAPGDVVRLLEARLTKQTRVISVSHVTYTTGLRLPIAEIAALARAHGVLLVVDGAQAPGGIAVDVKPLGCHAYATSAHKWLLAPMGTGLLCIRDEAKERIDPLLLAGGRRVYTANTGTRNLPSVLGLGAAIDWFERLGKHAVEKRCLELRALLCEKLQAEPKVQVISPPAGEFASPLVALELPKGRANAALAESLRKKHNIVVRVISSAHVNGIRLSTHIYNSEDDIARLVEALKAELS